MDRLQLLADLLRKPTGLLGDTQQSIPVGSLLNPATVNPLMARKVEAQRQTMPIANALTRYNESYPQNWQQFGENVKQAFPTPASGGSRDDILKAATNLAMGMGPQMIKPVYQGAHMPPMKDSGAPAHDLTGGGKIYPDDVYSPRGPQYYGHFGGNDPIDRQTFQILSKIKGAPDAEITIYRAVPKDTPASAINSGDWVTVNKAYAKQHGESTLNGEYKIIEQKVRAKDVFTNGDSIHEWGYDPSPLK